MLGSSRDTGWLVVLFIYLIFIFPIIKLVVKNKTRFVFFIILLLYASFLLLFENLKIPFRYTMWLPWSLFVAFAYILTKIENKKYSSIFLILVPFVLFFLSKTLLVSDGKSLIFTDNKYPPNLYYLSYGVWTTAALYFGYKMLESKKLITNSMQKIFYFFSFHSYSLFFIHFLYIYIFTGLGFQKSLNWWSFFVVILLLSIVTQIVINKIYPIIKGATPK